MSFQGKELVSIIIPVYNRELFVEKTLFNILENVYRPLELILVNDGSMDNSLEVLRKFKTEHEDSKLTVKILSQKNQGAPAARNLGYKNASGKYIQFLDSDDMIDPNKFVLQIPQMLKSNADFGLCDFEMVYTDSGKIVHHSNKKKLKKVLRTNGSFGCGSPLLAKELSDKISWNINPRRNQEVDYFLKAALIATKIAYVEMPLYTYVRHSSERISASYSKTVPVYYERIVSLKSIFRLSPRKMYASLALMNLYLSLFKYKLGK